LTRRIACSINLIAKTPLISATTNAAAVGKASICNLPPLEINSYKNDAIIIGIDIKKENSAAFSRSVPIASIVEIVIPLRERPGITAMP